MLTNLIKNIFGTRNTRIIKEYRSLVKKINGLEDKYQKFSESDFINETTNYFHERPKFFDDSSVSSTEYIFNYVC